MSRGDVNRQVQADNNQYKYSRCTQGFVESARFTGQHINMQRHGSTRGKQIFRKTIAAAQRDPKNRGFSDDAANAQDNAGDDAGQSGGEDHAENGLPFGSAEGQAAFAVGLGNGEQSLFSGADDQGEHETSPTETGREKGKFQFHIGHKNRKSKQPKDDGRDPSQNLNTGANQVYQCSEKSFFPR